MAYARDPLINTITPLSLLLQAMYTKSIPDQCRQSFMWATSKVPNSHFSKKCDYLSFLIFDDPWPEVHLHFISHCSYESNSSQIVFYASDWPQGDTPRIYRDLRNIFNRWSWSDRTPKWRLIDIGWSDTKKGACQRVIPLSYVCKHIKNDVKRRNKA